MYQQPNLSIALHAQVMKENQSAWQHSMTTVDQTMTARFQICESQHVHEQQQKSNSAPKTIKIRGDPIKRTRKKRVHSLSSNGLAGS